MFGTEGAEAMRILVIEDESRIRSFVARGLEAEGYSVEGAADGQSGLALALGPSWDLIVLDLLLPGTGGLDVLRELHSERPEVPVLVLSARSDLATKLRGFELGAVDYLPKPFALDELLARVRVQLRKAAAFSVDESGNLVRGAHLTLDLARRQARFNGTVCDLADREFRVLHHLLLHEGEVVSRERLLADVWLQLPPGLECRRRLRAAPAEEAGPRCPDRNGPPCRLSPGCVSTPSRPSGSCSPPRISS